MPTTLTEPPADRVAEARPPEPARLPRRLVALLAVTAGASVANLYYVQPLLNVVGDALGVSEATAGLLVTCSQVGYVAGLALLAPAGDLVERRPRGRGGGGGPAPRGGGGGFCSGPPGGGRPGLPFGPPPPPPAAPPPP